jgi:hypothetical protein
MNVEIGAEAAQFPEKELLLQCCLHNMLVHGPLADPIFSLHPSQVDHEGAQVLLQEKVSSSFC